MIVFQSTLLPYIICGIRNSIKSPLGGRRTFLGGVERRTSKGKFETENCKKEKREKKEKKGKEKSLF